MKKITVFVLATIVIGLFISCQQPITNTPMVKAPIDSLVANWNNGWNSHDSVSVRNLFTEDALLTDENLIAIGVEEISLKMIHPNINIVNNLKTEKLQEWSTNDRAGYAGTYELEIIVDGSVVAKVKGLFTLNWMKTDKAEWKITTAVLYSFTEQK